MCGSNISIPIHTTGHLTILPMLTTRIKYIFLLLIIKEPDYYWDQSNMNVNNDIWKYLVILNIYTNQNYLHLISIFLLAAKKWRKKKNVQISKLELHYSIKRA